MYHNKQTKHVWVCGEYKHPFPWEIIGIFDNEQDAVKACTKSNHFVGKVELNTITYETEEWLDLRYPIVEAEFQNS